MVLVIATALLMGGLTGCGGRPTASAPGRGIDAESAEQARDRASRDLAAALNRQLDGSARADVAIAELPRWNDGRRQGHKGWSWSMASVQVNLVTDDDGAPAVTIAEARQLATDRLRPLVQGGDHNLLIRVTHRRDAKLYAALGGGGPQPVLVSAAMPLRMSPPAARRYVVQRGDTLASISQRFYGSPTHVRRIAGANQLATETVRPGMDLIIPAID